MKKIFFCLIIFFSPNIVFGNTFTETVIQNINFQYVTYAINSQVYNIKIAVSDNAISLEDLTIKYNGITAINGVFFCPADYLQCKEKDYTINERFVQGEDLSFYKDTGARGVFSWDKLGIPFIYQTNQINPNKRKDIYEGLGNFPIIYANGVNMLEKYHDIGLYDSKMRAPLSRHFICSNKNKTKIIFGRTGATSLDNLAPALYELGCWDALNLDAGNSAQYIYNGEKLVSGVRKILDAIVIERIGFDVQKLETKLNILMSKISRKYKKYPREIALNKINTFLKIIPKIRNEINKKNTILEKNTLGETIGYSINISSLSELRRMYLMNSLEIKLKKLFSQIQN